MQTSQYSIRERVGQYRVRMQSKGLRQVNIWVPDTRSASFAKECRRQSMLAARMDRKDGVLKALDRAARDTEGWTA